MKTFDFSTHIGETFKDYNGVNHKIVAFIPEANEHYQLITMTPRGATEGRNKNGELMLGTHSRNLRPPDPPRFVSRAKLVRYNDHLLKDRMYVVLEAHWGDVGRDGVFVSESFEIDVELLST